MLKSVRQISLAAIRNGAFAAAALLMGSIALIASDTPAGAVEFETWLHGSSLMGDPKYPGRLCHFDYVNADAPKEGRVRLADSGGFDSFNIIIPQGGTGHRPRPHLRHADDLRL